MGCVPGSLPWLARGRKLWRGAAQLPKGVIWPEWERRPSFPRGTALVREQGARGPDSGCRYTGRSYREQLHAPNPKRALQYAWSHAFRETKAVRPGGLGIQGPPAGVSIHIGKALLIPPEEALRGLGVKEGEVSSTQGSTELIRCGGGEVGALNG